jgi:hypothetical protein
VDVRHEALSAHLCWGARHNQLPVEMTPFLMAVMLHEKAQADFDGRDWPGQVILPGGTGFAYARGP